MPAGLLAAVLCAAAAQPLTLPPSAGVAAHSESATNHMAPGNGAPPAKKKTGKPPMTGVLNVNRATEAELRLLPGIGKKRAELIVARRQKRPFASVDEVGRIKGMRALVQRLRSKLTVQGDTTLRPFRP
jgi:competence protein ComEA